MSKNFQGKIYKEARLTYLEIPFNPSVLFNIKGKIEVEVTINKVTFIKSLLSRGNGKYILTFNKEMMKKMSIDVGDVVEASIGLVDNKNIKNTDDPLVLKYYDKVEKKRKSLEELSVLESIFTRRSIRQFTDQVVEQDKIELMLKAASYAPSAENKRPFEFIVIKDRESLNDLSKVMTRGRMLKEASCALIVCGDTEVQKQKGFLVEDCSAAIQNILLAAHGMGLGAVWCGIYPMTKVVKDVKTILGIPSNILPVGIVAIGYTDDRPVVANRYDKSKVHMNKW